MESCALNSLAPRFPTFDLEETRPDTAYHPGLLSLRARSSARRFLGSAPYDRDALLPRDTGAGFRSLHQLERAGLLRSVIPLAVTAAERPTARARGALGRLALSIPEEPGSSPLEGGSLVAVDSEEDAEWLRRRLAEDPEVESVARVPIRYRLAPAVILAVPPPTPTLWNLTAIEWAAARALPGFKDAADRKVAVLDTGIDEDHPGLETRVASYVHDYPHPLSSSVFRPDDVVGHGTHVAGTIAALANDGYGVDGVSAAQIYAYKVFPDQATALVQGGPGVACYTYVADPMAYLLALDDCLRQGIDVVNLSLGGPGNPEPNEGALFDALLGRGTVLVAAMGNDGLDGSPTTYPAALPGVIAVGASRQDDRIADFSSRGPHISLCAPGVAIWSTLPTYPGHAGFRAIPTPEGGFQRGRALPRETEYDAWDGTSMAAAHVSGAVALLLANRGPLSPAEVKRRLEATAGRVPGMGGLAFDPAYGHGRLNLRRLLQEE